MDEPMMLVELDDLASCLVMLPNSWVSIYCSNSRRGWKFYSSAFEPTWMSWNFLYGVITRELDDDKRLLSDLGLLLDPFLGLFSVDD